MSSVTACTWLPIPFDVSVPHSTNWKDICGVIWSMVANLWILFALVVAVITRRLFWIMVALYGALLSAINQIPVAIVHQHRPKESCAPDDDNGMPSGHAMNYAMYLIWMSYEILTNPMLELSLCSRILLLWGPIILWGPGFPARVQVHDHTWEQIYVGAADGTFWAILWILFLHFYFRPYGVRKLMNLNIIQKLGIHNDYYPIDEKPRDLATTKEESSRLLGANAV